MARIWSDEGRLEAWLAVELAATAAWSELGVVPAEAAAAIQENAKAPTPERVAEIEATLHHDTAAFVDAVSERLGEEGRWFHYGLTSSDVVDTALAIQIREAGALILEGLDRSLAVVTARAEQHRNTLQMGRTHGVHAEPTTFGVKLVGWAFELDRARTRVGRALDGMPSAPTRRPTPSSSGSPASASVSSPPPRRRRSSSATGTQSCSPRSR
jgi:adenylosuccinate lyase